MLKKLIYVFLIFSTLLYASDAVDACAKNFDDEIQKQQDLKTNLEVLKNFCSSKQIDVKSAYRSVAEFDTKIRNITKRNLIKSTLKLGYATYEEISPLGGIEGKLTEISTWLADKAKGYVVDQAKQTLGIAPKDYYNEHIDLLSKDLSKLTPEVKLLTQMQNAGLEAFKIKVQREQNQTVGDVGALYAKLRNLADQSEKAKRSLYAFYRELSLIAINTQAELNQINTIILSYQKQKTRTCNENPPKEVEPEELGGFITLTPFSIDTPSVSEADCNDPDVGSIGTLRNKIITLGQDLESSFLSDLGSFLKSVYDDKNATLCKTYRDINISGFEDSFPAVCYLKNEQIITTEANSRKNYSQALSLWKTYIKHLQDMKSKFDDFANSPVLTYPEIDEIKKDAYSLRILQGKYGHCSGVTTSVVPDVNIIAKSMIDRVKNEKKTFVDGITEAKKYELAYQKWVDDIEQNVQDAWACVARDDNDLSIILPQINEVLNYFDEQDMAAKNLIDYMENLKTMGMVNKNSSYEAGIHTTYLNYNINDDYFIDMYDNFKGTDLEFIQKVQDILRPIGEDVSKLNSIIASKKSLIDATYFEVANRIDGFLARTSYPLQNISQAQNLKDLLGIAQNKAREHLNIYENVSKFASDMAGGNIPYLPHRAFLKLITSMQTKEWQLKEQLKMSDWTISTTKDFKDYKECINSIENFEYQVQSVVDLSSLGLTNLQDTIDVNKTKLKNTAVALLLPNEAQKYDLYANPSSCKASLMSLELKEKSISIVGNGSYVLDVNVSSCDDRNITLSADVNESLNNIHVGVANQKVTVTSDGIDNKDLILILKLKDVNHGNIITKQIPLHLVSSIKTIALKKGWNLINGGFDTSHVNSDISIIWSFQDGAWYAGSPYNNIKNLIQKVSISSYIKDLFYPKQNLGVWVYAIKDTQLNVDAQENSENLVINRIGWSLVGNSADINLLSDITCKDAALDAVWRYKDDIIGWKVYIKDGINEIEQIKTNSGFWVHCKN